MALAITPFEALCGFLPFKEIVLNLRATSEVWSLVPTDIIEGISELALLSPPEVELEREALRDVFEAIMSADPPWVALHLQKLTDRYEGGGAQGENQRIVDLVMKLHEDFPGDVGIFCAFMLNHVSLQPGEAIFLGAGEPHAYISGGTD